MQDICNIWDGANFNFTLNKISQITGIEIPEHFKAVADDRISELTIGPLKKKDGLRVLFVMMFNKNHNYVQDIKQGVVVVSTIQFEDENGQALQQILLSKRDLCNAWISIGRYLKGLFKMPTIGITGSVGKTTLTAFIECIFKERGKVFVSGGNLNTYQYFVREMIARYRPDYAYHIQEVGAGNLGLVEGSARVLDVDAFCIANIYPQHLDNYKTMDNILYDKASFDRLAKEDAFGVINIDDDRLRNYQYKSRMVTCGIEHTEADYVARNVRQNGAWLECDVVHHQHTLSVRVNIPGVHNAYNVVLAIAMAKEWGLTDDEIQRGLLNYKSHLWRQNIQEVSGRTIYFDCFNSSTASLISTTKTLESMKKDGNRTIAVLGGMISQGELNYAINYEVGLRMSDYDIDEFIIYGRKPPTDIDVKNYTNYESGYALYQGAVKALRGRVTLCETAEGIANKLVKETKPGDVILLKGSGFINFISIADIAFGTSYTFFDNVFASSIWLNEGKYSLNYYDVLNGGSLMKCPANEGAVKIPNMVAKKPVFRICKGLFRNRKDITEVDFGRSVVNIGNFAFKGCSGIKALVLPRNVIHIEEEAFAECTGLEVVVMPGVEHIEKSAFKNCVKLKSVILSENCLTIEDGAFSGCKNFTIEAPAGSYAKEFANKSKGNYDHG